MFMVIQVAIVNDADGQRFVEKTAAAKVERKMKMDDAFSYKPLPYFSAVAQRRASLARLAASTVFRLQKATASLRRPCFCTICTIVIYILYRQSIRTPGFLAT